MSSSADSIASRRGIYISLAVVVFVLGIVSRRVELRNEIWDKYLGDALYAVIFYLGLAIIWPSQSIVVRALATAVFVICVECFQITGIPAQMRKNGNALMRLAAVVLGTKFSWWDMLAYFVGLVMVVGIDGFVIRAKK